MPEIDKDIEEGKIWAFIGYWGILFLVPLLGKKDNKFAVFHGKQGMVLCIGAIAVLIVFTILSLIPYVGILFMIIEWLVLLAIGVLGIIGMIKSLTGDYWKMPIFGDIAEKINI
ncbi:MAG TPA: hypothetical protein ENI34_02835 [candidate division WOR-3 bacterium]|uniref:DUF4870 domain-containing protein n=1 Tax=candidate division WOR-3 bacterium TaxID=2052148 RepID=A0A9C9ELA5_UNCW3|nr:hypothetical protein [candidate division WOR-3 bacterium]